MSRSGPPVVAHLGRPETPAETAARKAESSRAYKSSQTVRHLIVALLVTLLIVAVIYFAVPRGTLPASMDIDVAATSQEMAQAEGRTLLTPEIPATWREHDGTADHAPWHVNLAAVDGTAGARAWTVVYVPDTVSFLRMSQAFDEDVDWASRLLGGSGTSETVTIDGVEWDLFTIRDSEAAGNITYAIGTQAGPDYVLLYGTADADTAADLAGLLTDQITDLQKELP